MRSFNSLVKLSEFNSVLGNKFRDLAGMELDDVESTDFTGHIGGQIFVVETLDDLANVKGQRDLFYSGVVAMTEAVGVYDVAEDVGDGFFFFMVATNDGGGNGYFVPASLTAVCPNIEATVEYNAEK